MWFVQIVMGKGKRSGQLEKIGRYRNTSKNITRAGNSFLLVIFIFFSFSIVT